MHVYLPLQNRDYAASTIRIASLSLCTIEEFIKNYNNISLEK